MITFSPRCRCAAWAVSGLALGIATTTFATDGGPPVDLVTADPTTAILLDLLGRGASPVILAAGFGWLAKSGGVPVIHVHSLSPDAMGLGVRFVGALERLAGRRRSFSDEDDEPTGSRRNPEGRHAAP